ncbi:ROK family protein [Saccharopolyspora terrae]|uniref:ROK family protein n=1 Tax=Saccharopolyspora terrae TaxID=2530384 RepID=UPI00140441AD|nr:ROK family protein [Saccharopolyspora terrae]
MSDVLIGVDIGGTEIVAGLVHDGGRVSARRSCPTPRTGGRDIVERANGLVTGLLRESAEPVRAVGVGAPGTIDPVTGRVTSCTDTVPGWLGTEIAGPLSERAGVPVAVDNDVRAAAAAVALDERVREHGRVLYVSLGTGVGGALIVDGRVLRGRFGTHGEIAHLIAPERGHLPCGCGRHDHLEAVAAGPAIAAAYAVTSGDVALTLHEVAARLRDGEQHAAAVVERAGRLLGRTLSGLITALDLDAVVVAGGATALGAPLLDPLSEALDAESRPTARRTPVLRPATPDAPVLGAALVAAHHLPGGRP